jgi:hypothetical protein
LKRLNSLCLKPLSLFLLIAGLYFPCFTEANPITFTVYSETAFEISERTNLVEFSFASFKNTTGEVIHFGSYNPNLNYLVGGYTMKWTYYIGDAQITGIHSYIFDIRNWENWEFRPDTVYGLSLGFDGLVPTAEIGATGIFYLTMAILKENQPLSEAPGVTIPITITYTGHDRFGCQWQYFESQTGGGVPIPEPSTIILMSFGLLGLLGICIKRRCKVK